MIKVGITGGIGSGKTTVCRIFEHFGVAVYYADERSKDLIQTDIKLIRNIKKTFGSDLYDSNNVLDKAALATIVFHDDEKLKKLNSIVHPSVLSDFNIWCSQHQHQAYIIKESALLFETNAQANLDILITVFAPLEIRIKRIQERDPITQEEIMSRIKSQMPDNEKMSRSDYVIFNDLKHSLVKQVSVLHKELCKSLI